MHLPLRTGAALLAVAASASAAHAQLDVFMDGLANPRGLTLDGGTVYVAEAGTGGAVAVGTGAAGTALFYGQTGRVSARALGGAQSVYLSGLPSLAAADGTDGTGPSDVGVAGDGRLYTLFGFVNGPAFRAASPLADQPNANYFGQLVRRDFDATLAPVADVTGFEAANPDGADVNSNPFRLAFVPGGGAASFAVADAGANDVLLGNVGGAVGNPIVQPARPNPLFPGFGPPTYQSVPTGVAYSADGATLYTSELTGFPFVQGEARVTAYDLSGPTPVASVLADGLTNLTDVAVGPDGTVYALSYDLNGLLAPGDAGGLFRVNPDGTATLLVSDGLVNPTGLVISDDGTAYVSNFGDSPTGGQVVTFSLVPEPTGVVALALCGTGLLVRRRRVSLT